MLGPTRKLTSFDLRETNLGISSPVTDPTFANKQDEKTKTKPAIKYFTFILLPLTHLKVDQIFIKIELDIYAGSPFAEIISIALPSLKVTKAKTTILPPSHSCTTLITNISLEE